MYGAEQLELVPEFFAKEHWAYRLRIASVCFGWSYSADFSWLPVKPDTDSDMPLFSWFPGTWSHNSACFFFFLVCPSAHCLQFWCPSITLDITGLVWGYAEVMLSYKWDVPALLSESKISFLFKSPARDLSKTEWVLYVLWIRWRIL